MSTGAQTIPVVSAGLVALWMLSTAAGVDRWRRAWVVPALFMVVFLVISIRAVIAEGMLGFWADHTGSLWGNQIFADLLLAAGSAFALGAPRARRHGMTLWAWALLILATGSIGLCGYAARIMYLDARTPASPR